MRNSLKTITKFCDLLKDKIGYIAKMIKEEKTPMKVQTKMSRECKRLLEYGQIM